MSTDLFQALTLGLLVIVILALLVAVSMLGKVRAALEGRSADEQRTSGARDEAEGTSTATVEEVVAEVSGADRSQSALGDEPIAAEEAEPAVAAQADAGDPSTTSDDGARDEDSERPFERAGRWYFKRAGELLVYEEGTGEWVPADDGRSADAAPDVARQADAVDASTEPSATEAPARSGTGSVMASEPPGAAAAEPSTSFAGQPLATAEEEVATLGEEPAGGGEDTATAGLEEPGGEIDLDEAAMAEVPAARTSESFWKCESCGAINGSTATSCRMCFSARP